jgi:hypothetical protein
MKDLGRYEQVNIIECIEAYSLAVTFERYETASSKSTNLDLL